MYRQVGAFWKILSQQLSPVKSAWEEDAQRGTVRQVYPAISYRQALAAQILYAHKVRGRALNYRNMKPASPLPEGEGLWNRGNDEIAREW